MTSAGDARARPGSDPREPARTVVAKDGVVELAGVFEMGDVDRVWAELREAVGDGGRPTIDLSRVRRMDGGIMSLLVAMEPRELRGARGKLRRVQELYAPDTSTAPPKRRRAEGMVAHVGRATAAMLHEIRLVVAFFGHTAHGIVQAILKPRTTHFGATPRLVEAAAVDAVPIVVLLNFLIGFVMGYQAARQLETYGANIYVADLVGISVTRELAPLMTAIIVAGRSGAAFTAALGTMKVSEEFDALRALGVGPVRYLVLPRLLALIVTVPLLTIIGDVVGVVGGLVVAWSSLGVPPVAYVQEIMEAVHPMDVVTGLLKSGAFAWAIAVISCQQGFATTGGAEGVGKRTTSTVVGCLFAIVLLDALATVVWRSLGW